jgi:O-antigen ligase
MTGLAFMAVYLAALGIALFRFPVVGLFAYIGELYVHPPSRWWGEGLPDLRWSLLTAGVTLIAMLLHSRRSAPVRQTWYATVPARIMLVFVAWFWLMSLWALSPEQHFPAAVFLTKYLMVFLLVYVLIDTPAKVTAFLLAHLLGCLYLGYLGFQTGGGGRLDGVGGPGIDDSNTLGMHLGTGVVAGAMLVLHYKGWLKYLCVVAIAFAMNTIILTGSRGAFLALVAGGMMLVYLHPRAYRRTFYLYAALAIVLFGAIASKTFWERIHTVSAAVDETQTMDNSAESRIVMARAQLEMASLYPMGTGHRGSEFLSAQYLGQEYMTETGARSSHNAILTVLVEQGIPGVIMMLAMFGWVIRSLRQLKWESANRGEPLLAVHAAAVGGALMVVLVGGLFADFSKCEVQIWMFALLAAMTQKSMYAADGHAGAATNLPGAAKPGSVHIS